MILQENEKMLIHNKVEQIYREESEKIEKLYASGEQWLRQNEKSELIKIGLSLRTGIQDEMINLFEEIGVPYAYTAWGYVLEHLANPGYIYIDWKSTEVSESGAYEREVSQQDFEKVTANNKITVTAGCLTAGSLALIAIIPKGSTIGKIFVLVLVGVVAASGYVAVKSVTQVIGKEGNGQNQREKARTKADVQKLAIAEAKKTNLNILRQWCDGLEKTILDELEADI